MRSTRIAHLALAAIIGGTASCESGFAPAPVADVTLEDALEEVASGDALAAAGMAMVGGMPGPDSSGANTCSFEPAGRFQCPDRTVGGLTIRRHYYLLDAAGTPQSVWGPNVVAVRNVQDASGTFSISTGGDSVTASLTFHDDATLGGLRSATRTLTGLATGTTTLSGNTQTQSRATDLAFAGGSAHPTGTITLSAATVGSTLETTVTMTYDGTSIVKITRTSAGTLTTHCTFNLATPSVPPVCN